MPSGNESIKSGVTGGHNFNIWSDKMTEGRPLSGIFLLWWMLACIAGWVLSPFTFAVLMFRISRFIATLVPMAAHAPDTSTRILQMMIWGVLAGIVFGITFGVLQWLVLRKFMSRASTWILDTLLGICFGAPAAFVTTTGILPANPVLGILVVYVLPGIIVGLVQQLTLRRNFSRTWWWLVPSALGWPVIIVISEGESPIIFAVLAGLGLAIGAISGIVFRVISRSPKQRVAREVTRNRADIMLRSGLAVLLVALIIVAGTPLTHRYFAQRPLLNIKGESSGVANMSFSRSGALLAVGYFDGTARVWQVRDGELLGFFEHINKTAAGIPSEVGSPLSVAMSPDGKILASGLGGVEDTVKLWRVSDGALLQTIDGAGNGVSFSPDGQTLASLEMSVVVTDNPDRLKATQYYYTPVVLQAADGKRLLTGESFELGTQGFITSLVFSPDGKRIAAGFWNGAIRIWRAEDMSLTHTLATHVNMVGDVLVAFSPDSKTLAAGTDRGTIQLWRVDDQETQREISHYAVRGIAFSQYGDTLISVSANSLDLWNVQSMQLLQTLYLNVEDQDEFAFSHDTKTLASGDKMNGTIRIFNISE
jgi:WD40 repeat protein